MLWTNILENIFNKVHEFFFIEKRTKEQAQENEKVEQWADTEDARCFEEVHRPFEILLSRKTMMRSTEQNGFDKGWDVALLSNVDPGPAIRIADHILSKQTMPSKIAKAVLTFPLG